MSARQFRLQSWTIVVVVVFGVGATVGDVGSCGQEPTDLDAATFFDLKARIECRKCADCRLAGKLCDDACDETALVTTFRVGCRPLVHDGEVCLRKLLDGSCDDFAAYMDERSPQAPSECQFCPLP
ncbi:MAG TPA: hypothetical protein VJT73_07625 [Polyangiaceae bacterium]|nr:hypothetical protein [Polyangiaceae bacterium]